jgi:hypothetical protein
VRHSGATRRTTAHWYIEIRELQTALKGMPTLDLVGDKRGLVGPPGLLAPVGESSRARLSEWRVATLGTVKTRLVLLQNLPVGFHRLMTEPRR